MAAPKFLRVSLQVRKPRGMTPAGWGAAQLRGLQRVLLLMLGQARRNLTGPILNVDTGRGRSSVAVEIRRERGNLVGVVGTNVGYMIAHELGSDPYTIVPKQPGGLLRFVVGGDRRGRGGTVVFARRVRHPAIRARHWLERSAQQVLPAGRQEMQRELQAALDA